ncbi:hypothetical protein AAFF_G00354780 [Aldrovandia affinis]|uniref:Uncharacterized protein n=1 Tax=Aldrovandia affinis TaxID=143900 RepID=A0AAD7SIJ6_9TELE|nr:hypothetical protein AAFF_G00354780 [Aldrovandia affinis]
MRLGAGSVDTPVEFQLACTQAPKPHSCGGDGGSQLAYPQALKPHSGGVDVGSHEQRPVAVDPGETQGQFAGGRISSHRSHWPWRWTGVRAGDGLEVAYGALPQPQLVYPVSWPVSSVGNSRQAPRSSRGYGGADPGGSFADQIGETVNSPPRHQCPEG